MAPLILLGKGNFWGGKTGKNMRGSVGIAYS